MTSLTLKKIDFAGKESGSQNFDLASELDFQSPKSVAYVVRWQLARKRSGSAKTKTMAEISGTTAKPYKQKGTGNARQGSKRSVQFVGGRTCHGPTPRSFDFTMPKKIIKVALADALKLKLREEKLVVFSDNFSEIKTSQLSSSLKKNNVSSALILFNPESKNSEALIKSSRNLKNIKTLKIDAINVYDILSFDHLLIDNNILENIKGALQ